MLKVTLVCIMLMFFSLTTRAQEVCCHGPTAAQLMVQRGLSKIIQPNARKNIIADRETITEGYDAECSIKSERSKTPIEAICQPKSRKVNNKPADLRLELKGLDIDNLYKALAMRHNFYIDPTEDTKDIDGKTLVIVKFSPKNNLTMREVSDQFINRVSGSIYIDLDNLTIIRITGSVSQPFYFNYTILGLIRIRVDVYGFEFLVDYSPMNNVMVEKRVGGSADYEIRNRGTEKYDNRMTNYRIK